MVKKANLWPDFRQLVVKFGGSYLSNWWKRAVCEIKSKWLLHSAFLAPEAGIPGPTWTAEVFPTDAFVSSSSPEVLTASKSRFDKTVFEPLSSSASEESSIFSSDTSNLHLNKAILSVRPRKLIFFLFLKIKGFYEKTVYIRLIIYLKATYGKKKWKKSNFQLLPLNTQTLLTVTLKLLGTLIQI